MNTFTFFLLLSALIWTFVSSFAQEALWRLGSARALDAIHEHPYKFFYAHLHRLFTRRPSFESYHFASQTSSTLARVFLGFILWQVLLQQPEYSLKDQIFFIISSLVLIIIVSDLLPYVSAKKNPDRAFVFAMPISALFLTLTFPFTFLFTWISDLFSKRVDRLKGQDAIEQMSETLMHILLQADVKTNLSAADTKLLISVVRFKDRIVREVMVPRVDLFCLSIDTPIKEAAERFLEEGYSRIPVYQDSLDNIVGVLMFKDFLRLYKDAFDHKKESSFLNETVQSMMKGVLYTPETKKVSQLLQELRQKQTHLAIVVDEYGGTEGVVTMEDLLEEIVGDISDEYDFDEKVMYYQAPNGNGWIVDARLNLLDAEENFHIKIPHEGDYDTLAGYIFHKVGSLAKKGFVISHPDFDIEVLSSTDRQIEKVKITPKSSS